jgi:hypothetical protein
MAFSLKVTRIIQVAANKYRGEEKSGKLFCLIIPDCGLVIGISTKICTWARANTGRDDLAQIPSPARNAAG